MKHILSVLVENRAGVLYKVSGLFSRRSFNIESLVVGVTQDKDVSRMTIVIKGSDDIVEQVIKQLHKLIDVIKITDITENSISREFAFVKIRSTPETRYEAILLMNIMNAKIIDICSESITFEIAGDEEKFTNIKSLFEKYTILEMVKTGVVAIGKGSNSLKI